MPQGNFHYSIGNTYKTKAGNLVQVLDRTKEKGYECLICSDGIHRYDRSTFEHNSDWGRVTGTAHDYSCLDNFERYEVSPAVTH